MSCQSSKCRRLICPHEAAVAIDVGAEDSGEFAFHTHLSPHHPAGCNYCQISIGAETQGGQFATIGEADSLQDSAPSGFSAEHFWQRVDLPVDQAAGPLV